MAFTAVLASFASAVGAATCEYPGGQCYKLAMQKCREGSTTNTMTLHGLWAQWAENCHTSEFDAGKLESIRTELEAKWLSCPEDGGDNEKFWAHEWTRHGTCSGMDELTFFKTALALLDKWSSSCSAGGAGETCGICFTKDLTTPEQCSDEPEPSPGPSPGPPSSDHSCQEFGCGGFERSHACQCNDSCEEHGDCCSDYEETCGRSMSGIINV